MAEYVGKPQPCKDCEKRFLGCHDTCEDYAEFRKWRDMVNKARFESLEQVRVFHEAFRSGTRGKKGNRRKS